MTEAQPSSKTSVYARQCPSRELLVRIADKWAAIVIVALAERAHRFGELKRHIEGISQKMLTQTLRNLERDGLVIRTVFTGSPLQVEYSLTPLGHELTNVLQPLLTWAEDHVPEVLAHRDYHDESAS